MLVTITVLVLISIDRRFRRCTTLETSAYFRMKRPPVIALLRLKLQQSHSNATTQRFYPRSVLYILVYSTVKKTLQRHLQHWVVTSTNVFFWLVAANGLIWSATTRLWGLLRWFSRTNTNQWMLQCGYRVWRQCPPKRHHAQIVRDWLPPPPWLASIVWMKRIRHCAGEKKNWLINDWISTWKGRSKRETKNLEKSS